MTLLYSLLENVNAWYFDFLRPTTRYGQQNDVREQNRVLTATNEDLQRQLEEMKVITLIIHLMCRLNTFTGFLFVTNLCKVQKNYSNGAQCFFFLECCSP